MLTVCFNIPADEDKVTIFLNGIYFPLSTNIIYQSEMHRQKINKPTASWKGRVQNCCWVRGSFSCLLQETRSFNTDRLVKY